MRTAFIVVAFAAHAQAAQSSLPPEWLDNDEWHREVRYLIEAAELNDYSRLSTAQQREAFIARFWTARDPTPGTARNELREEYYRRIQHANDRFKNPLSGASGYETDRGRFYVLFGEPDQVETDSSAGNAQETWHYKLVPGMGNDAKILFPLRPVVSCAGAYLITSPAPLARFEARGDAAGQPVSVRVHGHGFTSFLIPVDFANARSVTWDLSTRSGVAIDQGSFGPARQGTLSEHFITASPFDAQGIACTHVLAPDSYAFVTTVTSSGGDVVEQTIEFDVK